MQYLTSEFHMSDEKAGELIGFKATLDVIFGFAGSFLTDIFGVRLTSLAGVQHETPCPMWFMLCSLRHGSGSLRAILDCVRSHRAQSANGLPSLQSLWRSYPLHRSVQGGAQEGPPPSTLAHSNPQ
eukprot:6280850-Amphidinium_carterae.1